MSSKRIGLYAHNTLGSFILGMDTKDHLSDQTTDYFRELHWKQSKISGRFYAWIQVTGKQKETEQFLQEHGFELSDTPPIWASP